MLAGLPWWLSQKEYACNARRGRFTPWVRKISWRRKWQPTPVFLLVNPMDRGAWRTTIHGVTRVTHHLTTKPSPPPDGCSSLIWWSLLPLLSSPRLTFRTVLCIEVQFQTIKMTTMVSPLVSCSLPSCEKELGFYTDVSWLSNNLS